MKEYCLAAALVFAAASSAFRAVPPVFPTLNPVLELSLPRSLYCFVVVHLCAAGKTHPVLCIVLNIGMPMPSAQQPLDGSNHLLTSLKFPGARNAFTRSGSLSNSRQLLMGASFEPLESM